MAYRCVALNEALLLIVLVTAALLAGGCASYPHAPVEIRTASSAVGFEQAQQEPAAFQGRQVRWGGVILASFPHRDALWVEVQEYPLAASGRPDAGEPSRGRLYVRLGRTAEPGQYPPGALVTVVGEVQEPVTQQIGEREYRHPALVATDHYLWPEPDYRHGYRHGYYGPYYGGYYRPRHYFHFYHH